MLGQSPFRAIDLNVERRAKAAALRGLRHQLSRFFGGWTPMIRYCLPDAFGSLTRTQGESATGDDGFVGAAALGVRSLFGLAMP